MKRFLSLLIIIIPVLLFSQEKSAENKSDKKQFPVQSVSTKLFKLQNLDFNKIITSYEGEILETQFKLVNQTDAPIELYIFVIASYESQYKTKSSFENPAAEDLDLIKNIKVFPDDITNFEYTEKDKQGKENKIYIKYPKNIKAGVNPATGKPYLLHEDLTFRATFLSKYGRKFYYFNEAIILIFDNKEELLYRQMFKVKPKKR